VGADQRSPRLQPARCSEKAPPWRESHPAASAPGCRRSPKERVGPNSFQWREWRCEHRVFGELALPVSPEQPASGDAPLNDDGLSCGESSEKVPRRFRDGVGGRGGRREGWEGACAGADRYLRPTPPPHSAGSRRGRATPSRARGQCGPRSCGGNAGSSRLGGGTGRRRGRRPPRRGAGRGRLPDQPEGGRRGRGGQGGR